MQEFEGKTVLISGAARGQGRAHAVRFAEEGASIVAVDICAPVAAAAIDMATPEELAETVRAVEAVGGRAVSAIADVRDLEALQSAVGQGVDAFGGIDCVIANAGICNRPGPFWDIAPADFQAVIDIDLVGAWNTMRAAIPGMIESGRRGSVVATSSGLGLKGAPSFAPYVAAKHGLIGLMKTAAKELAPHGIRANTVLPGNVNTQMFRNTAMRDVFVPEVELRSEEEFLRRATAGVPMGVPNVEPEDVTEAVFWLASSQARYVTGATLTVDGGSGIP